MWTTVTERLPSTSICLKCDSGAFRIARTMLRIVNRLKILLQ